MIELIDKDKAIKKLAFAQEQMYKAIGGVEDDTYKTLDTIQFCIDRISEIEPEEAEPIRQGFLHDVYQLVSGEILGVCSECGEEVPVRIRGNYVKYCPLCGAKVY